MILRSPAHYRQVELPEYQGNPLIAALPPIEPDEAIYGRFNRNIPSTSEDRSAPPQIRRKMLSRLNRYLFSLPDYVDIFRSIEDAIFEGYLFKNPLTPTGQHFLHYLEVDDTKVQPATGSFVPTGVGMSVFGESGAGKTAGIDCALAQFPQIIVHEEFEGRPAPIEQVAWLKIQCPSSATVWGYVTHILDELDRLFGTDEFASGPRPKNVEDAGIAIERRLRSLHLGFLVLDELQNLEVGKASLRKQLLNVLLHLINRSGIPVLFCGNQESKVLLAETLRNARRAEDGGAFDIEPIDPAIWPSFVESLWAHQFTCESTPLDEELSSALFHISRGLPKFAVNIYRAAQKMVIGSGEEKLTLDVLSEARLSACSLSSEILDRMPSPVEVFEAPNHPSCDVDTPPAEPETPEDFADESKIASANRIQHDELRTRLLLARQNGFALPLNVNADLLRSASDTNDPYEYLCSKDAVLTDLFSSDVFSEGGRNQC